MAVIIFFLYENKIWNKLILNPNLHWATLKKHKVKNKNYTGKISTVFILWLIVRKYGTNGISGLILSFKKTGWSVNPHPNCKYICLHVGLIPVYLLSENGLKIKGDWQFHILILLNYFTASRNVSKNSVNIF